MTHANHTHIFDSEIDETHPFRMDKHLEILTPALTALFKRNSNLQRDLVAAFADASLRPDFGWDLECALVRLDLNPFAEDARIKISDAMIKADVADRNAMAVQFGKASLHRLNTMLLDLLQKHCPHNERSRNAVHGARQVLLQCET